MALASAVEQRVVVVVEEEDAARFALEWAIHNFLRSHDIIVLLHVVHNSESSSASSSEVHKALFMSQSFLRKGFSSRNIDVCSFQGLSQLHDPVLAQSARRLSRLKGFHLALSFKRLCEPLSEAKIEIVVAEGEEGPTIVSTVRKIRASALILGLHCPGLFCRLFRKKHMLDHCIKNVDCKVLAVKHKKYVRTGRMISQIKCL